MARAACLIQRETENKEGEECIQPLHGPDLHKRTEKLQEMLPMTGTQE